MANAHPYLFSQIYPLLSSLFGRLLLCMFLSLNFTLVEARQVLGTGTVVKGDLLDGVGGFAFLRRRWGEGGFLRAWFSEHFFLGGLFVAFVFENSSSCQRCRESRVN